MATVDIFSPSVRKERSTMDRIHAEVARLRRTQTASEMFATRYDRPISTRNVRAEVPQTASLLASVTAGPHVVMDRQEFTSMTTEQLERMRQVWYTNPIVDAPIMTEQEEREMEEDLANMQLDTERDDDGYREVW